MDVLLLSSDPVFNYFCSIGVYWAFYLASSFAILSLFRA